ncbi:ABC transporter permease [Rugosimonospora acidiphila]|uniref:ABC transporter permease n=1 Tax=Rugosimonospora acidiphila TaxID=556531 RepID=A0ABP9S4N2_9ACTN
MSTVTSEAPADRQVGASGAPRGMSPWRLRYRRREPIVLGTLCLILVLVAWQVAADAGWVNKLFVSSPTDVARAMWDYITTAQFAKDLSTTGLTFIYGLLLSLVAGIVLGLLMGWYKRVGFFLDYLVSLVYASPRIALVPLLILWFGIGRTTGIAMVFLMSVFPVLINTMTGVHSVDPLLIEMARSQKASRLQLIRTVVLPGALPQVLSGVRLAIGNGLIGVVVAEFLAGSSSGLGFTMQAAAQSFEAPQLFAGLVIISALGLIATQLLRILERRFQRWRTS